jgi:ADP-ribose pyrophosphatase
MKRWKKVEPTVITKIDYQNVIVKTFTLPNNDIVTRATFFSEGHRAAGTIAVTKDKKIIVAKQYRPGPEKILEELPGGFVDAGEEPEAAARRELLEETGYTPGSMIFLGEFPRDAYVNGTWYYFLALDCEHIASQALEDDEFVTYELRSIEDFLDNAKKGNMTDPGAVLAAYEKLKQLQKED